MASPVGNTLDANKVGHLHQVGLEVKHGPSEQVVLTSGQVGDSVSGRCSDSVGVLVTPDTIL